MLVAVGGLSGTGKSVLARALAPELGPPPGAVVLRSDVERKALFGRQEHEKLPEEAYAPMVTARVYATIVDKARRVVAAGHAAIVDAVFAQPGERRVVEQSAAILGVAFHGLFLDADIAMRLARVGARGRDASDADAAVARQQESYDLSALDWPRDRRLGQPGRDAGPRTRGDRHADARRLHPMHPRFPQDRRGGGRLLRLPQSLFAAGAAARARPRVRRRRRPRSARS